MSNLTEEQKQAIREVLSLLADERIRVRRVIDENIVNSIKLEEVERKLARSYKELRRIIYDDVDAT